MFTLFEKILVFGPNVGFSKCTFYIISKHDPITFTLSSKSRAAASLTDPRSLFLEGGSFPISIGDTVVEESPSSSSGTAIPRILLLFPPLNILCELRGETPPPLSFSPPPCPPNGHHFSRPRSDASEEAEEALHSCTQNATGGKKVEHSLFSSGRTMYFVLSRTRTWSNDHLRSQNGGCEEV